MKAPRKAKLKLYNIKYTWDCCYCGGLNFIDSHKENDPRVLMVTCYRCGRRRGATVTSEWWSHPSSKLRKLLAKLQKRFFASLKKGKPQPLKRAL